MNLSGSYSNNNINYRFSGSFNLQHPYLYSAEAIDLEKLESFLKSGDENCCIIRLWLPKIVQRSYGTEKRFFCPPPLIALLGNGWNTNKNEMTVNLARFRMQLQDAYRKPGITAEERNRIKAVLNQIPNLPLRINLNVGINDGTTPFVRTVEDEIMIRNLFIHSVDRRRYFKFSCDLTDCLGSSVIYPARFIGNFESSEIRVVSKPAKKQSVRAPDAAYVSLKSGMQVALFHRTRAQSVATRYLFVDDPFFVAHLDRWSSFYIYAVNTDESPDSGKSFVIRQGFICYNHVVRLVDVVTGVSTPNLILRRVDKGIIEVAPFHMNEPIAMLQRIAFQFCDTASTYLGLNQSTIIQKSTRILSYDAHESDDSIAWCITNCEMIEYKYFEIMGPTLEPITPVPFIKHAQLEEEQNAVIEFCGINLGLHLNVYFGIFICTRLSANSMYIRCIVPSLLQVSEDNVGKTTENGCYQVPISLIRNDGVLYPTDIEFQYSSNSVSGIGKIVFRTPLTENNGEKQEGEEDGEQEEGDKRYETTLTEDKEPVADVKKEIKEE